METSPVEEEEEVSEEEVSELDSVVAEINSGVTSEPGVETAAWYALMVDGLPFKVTEQSSLPHLQDMSEPARLKVVTPASPFGQYRHQSPSFVV